MRNSRIGAALVIAVATTAAFAMIETAVCPEDVTDGDRFGYAAAVFADRMVIGAHGDDDAAPNAGAVYVFARDHKSWNRTAKLVADDGATMDLFGAAVDLDGDRIVVGAYSKNEGMRDTGAAYVFRRTDTGWMQEAKLLPADPDVDMMFGWSVAIDGDRVVVGTNRVIDPGVAYVFRLEGAEWLQEARLQGTGPLIANSFGYSVAIDGDAVLVGAFRESGAGFQSGTAYVFRREGTTWNPEARLESIAGSSYARFGYSVALSGDVAVVGAVGDDPSGVDSGCVHVYRRTEAGWNPEVRLAAPDGAAFDEFGRSVAVSGDTIVAGGGRWQGGYAQRFRRAAGTWAACDCLEASDGIAGDGFGRVVALDRRPWPSTQGRRGIPVEIDTIVVGAPYQLGEGYCGAAYVYVGADPAIVP